MPLKILNPFEELIVLVKGLTEEAKNEKIEK